MMVSATLNGIEKKLIDTLVKHYVDRESLIRRFLISFYEPIDDATEKNEPLAGLVHSIKYRMKDPSHLREKLVRKLLEFRAKGEHFPYNGTNLFERVNDLGGCRILHLHTSQVAEIHPR